MDLKWLIDWEVANRHPRRTQFALFIGGLLAGGAVAFFRFADHDPLEALLAGVVAGLLLLFVGRRFQRDPAAASAAASRSHVFEIVLTTIGLGVVIAGALTRTPSLAFSGIPFCVLALILFGVKRVLSRKS